jgi:hypothetical protein
MRSHLTKVQNRRTLVLYLQYPGSVGASWCEPANQQVMIMMTAIVCIPGPYPRIQNTTSTNKKVFFYKITTYISNWDILWYVLSKNSAKFVYSRRPQERFTRRVPG